jgi:cytoskeletal protein CcmA (bactofilin family)
VARGDGPAASVLQATRVPAPPHGPQALRESARSAPGRPDLDTIIGTGARLEGRLAVEGTVRVYGSVQGELISSGTIVVEQSGRVVATITAARVFVDGQVEGLVRGSGRVELRPTARVQGELHAGVLVVEEGASFEGRASMVDAVTSLDGRHQAAEPAN